MTLRKSIFGGYGLVLALVGMVLVWATINLVHLGQASESILRENYKSILAANTMVAALDRQDSQILLSLMDGSPEAQVQRRDEENRFLEWLGRAKDNVTVPGEDQIIRRIDEGFVAYQRQVARITELAATNRQAAAGAYRDSGRAALAAVRVACERLKEVNQGAMYEASRRAQAVTAEAISSTLAVGIGALVVGLVVSLLLSARLVRPLLQVIDAVRQIGRGNYAVQVPSGTTDELGHLSTELNVMADRLLEYHNLNVDQLVAAKRKNEAILRSIDDGLVVIDRGLRVTEVNAAAITMLGLAAGDLEGEPLERIIRDERVLDYVRRTTESGQAQEIEADAVLKVDHDGQLRHLLFSVTPVKARTDGLLAVVVVLRDVTRLKELEQLKSQFVMTASHELRTPLTSIGMGIELLVEGALDKLDDRQRQLLLTAHEEVQRLKGLVTDLLDLAKIEAGQIAIEFGRVSMPAVFAKVQSIFATQAEGQRIVLRAETDPGLPEAWADANKVTWVLTNLVSNALRYVAPGGHVELSARRTGDRLQVAVRDDGSGIPLEAQTRIFEKFVQLGDGGGHQGAGLGLAICREIVRAHGGAIWVESAPGAGSTFTFTVATAE